MWDWEFWELGKTVLRLGKRKKSFGVGKNKLWELEKINFGNWEKTTFGFGEKPFGIGKNDLWKMGGKTLGIGEKDLRIWGKTLWNWGK